jgi:hypothetical protein
MARPQKNNADYFPHDNDMRNDRRCKALRSKFNLEGYAVFVMLLETLTGANHFQIEDNKMELELIAGDIDIDSKKLNAILEYLIKLGLLVKEGELISSPMLNDLKNILNDVREKDRGRKSIPAENSTKENSTKENGVFQSENEVFHTENTQSKVKESKGKKRKENEIKEKGNKENLPPIFLNNFSTSENRENNLPLNNEKEYPKEKSSAKKENPSAFADTEITNASQQNFVSIAIPQCKKVFERFSPMYVWESKDNEQLVLLLQKILITKPNLQNEYELADAFLSLIQKLPEYWRTKKFTIPNLNANYNEIVSEIRAKQKSSIKQPVYKPIVRQTEVKKEPTEAEKKQIRQNFIKSICECYEKYVDTGEHGFIPLWVMHDTLVEEKILKLSEKKLETYRNQAIEQRKAELKKPQNAHETRVFRGLLENFSSELANGNEKNKIEIAIKNLAVKGLFDELKKNKTDIKKLFKL